MYDILNELKRRKVFRAAMSYAIVSWLLIQISTAIFPVFEAPPWALKIFLMFIAAGFPLALILAWAYDLSPDGLRRTTTDSLSAEPPRWRAMDSFLVLALVFLLGITTLDRSPSLMLSVSPDRVISAIGGAGNETTRLAVMPFATLNSDDEVKQLSDGFAESLHQIFGELPELVVTGMASSVRIADDQLSRAEIFEKLKTDYLIEGSIRINNDDVNVFAQLVRLPEGETVWSGEFVEDRIGLASAINAVSEGIAATLGVELPAEGPLSGLPPDALRSWLRFLGLMRRSSEERIEELRILAEGIVERAPAFGPGHAAAALTLAKNAAADGALDFDDRVAAIDTHIKDALTVAPASAQALHWVAKSQSLMLRWRGNDADFARIDQAFDEALQALPRSAELLTAFAEHKLAWGDTSQAMALAQRAIEVDPMSPSAREIRIQALIRAGRREAAEAEIDSLEDSPKLATRLRARLEISRGNLKAALDSYMEIAEHGGELPPEALGVWAATGDPTQAARIAELLESSPRSEIWHLALHGQYADAFDLANSQLQATDPETVILIGVLATQAGKYESAIETFSHCFSDWLRDVGPLRGEAAKRFAPWFARALIEAGRADEGRRLLDRHLAGLIAIETQQSRTELGPYLAANYATLGRLEDAQRVLDRAGNDGLRLTYGILGPVDPLQSTIFGGLDLKAAARQ